MSGYKSVSTLKHTMNYRGMSGIMRDEGIINSLRVMSKFVFKPRIRERMKRLNRFFRTYPEYTGYGIYITTK